MAFELVNPAAAFWAEMGLRHVLMNYDVLGQPSRQHEAMKGASLRKTASQAWRSKAYPPQRPSASASGGVSAKAWAEEKGGITATSDIVGKQAARPASFTPLPLEQWPAIWREQFSKTKKGLFGWTYWNLGADLLGARENGSEDEEAVQGRKARSKIMGRLLRELGHPPGTHTFWPPYLERAGGAQPEMFWSGLKFLGCRGVIIFGSQAARALIEKPGLRPLQHFSANGFRIWIMKDLSTLEQDRAHYASMLVLLKETLKGFIRR